MSIALCMQLAENECGTLRWPWKDQNLRTYGKGEMIGGDRGWRLCYDSATDYQDVEIVPGIAVLC